MVLHHSPTVDFNFLFNYPVDRKEDHSGITSVIARLLLCVCVVCVLLDILRSTIDLTRRLNEIHCLLTCPS